MLELYQFQHSAFCLKVRLALNAKNLTYRVIEVTPAIGQVELFKLSGQRQVPVLKDGQTVIADSTKILKYLDSIAKPALFPKDPHEAAIACLIEDWADTTFAKTARLELVKAAASDPYLRKALLPEELPESFKGVINRLPCEFVSEITQTLTQNESDSLLNNLEGLSNALTSREWLVGNSLSIADIAVAAQLSLLRFPYSSGRSLCGKGCAGFSDNPKIQQLFLWRDNLEKQIMETDPAIF